MTNEEFYQILCMYVKKLTRVKLLLFLCQYINKNNFTVITIIREEFNATITDSNYIL